MKTGDVIIRHSNFGVALETGPIRPMDSRKKAREVCRWYETRGKKARVIENIESEGWVTR